MPRDVFIVGPARAGTSWLQTILAEHPDIASPSETGLFVEFLGPAQLAWQRHRSQLQAAMAHGDEMNVQGLATVLTDDDMLVWHRSLYERMRARVLAEKPGATRMLEKTPDHAMYIDLILRVVPEAFIIFLVRDPRDTVRSMLQASTEPWGHWASVTVEGATDRWLRNVHEVLGRLNDERLMVVRYEDLLGGDAELRRVAVFLELADPAMWMKFPTDASPGERRSTIIAGEAAEAGLSSYDLVGFSFHDRERHRELSKYELAYVESLCGDEMQALGYSRLVHRVPIGFGARRRARFAILRARNLLRRQTRLRSSERRVPGMSQ